MRPGAGEALPGAGMKQQAAFPRAVPSLGTDPAGCAVASRPRLPGTAEFPLEEDKCRRNRRARAHWEVNGRPRQTRPAVRRPSANTVVFEVINGQRSLPLH